MTKQPKQPRPLTAEYLCPVCGGELRVYKTKPRHGECVRRLRRCKNRKGCGYRESITVRIHEVILHRKPLG